MRIEATCKTCGRTFLLSQIGPDSDAPGRCPFCGARFARHYSPVLIETAREAEVTLTHLVQVLGRLQGMETGFDLQIDQLLDELGERVRAHDRGRLAS